MEFAEQILGDTCWAMVSTNKVASWPKVPKRELLNALAGKPRGKLARSDQLKQAQAPWFTVDCRGVIEARIDVESQDGDVTD